MFTCMHMHVISYFKAYTIVCMYEYLYLLKLSHFGCFIYIMSNFWKHAITTDYYPEYYQSRIRDCPLVCDAL